MVEFIPRLQQMSMFVEACAKAQNRYRKNLFKSFLALTDDEVNTLLFNGLVSLESPLHHIFSILQQIETQRVEQFIRETLADLKCSYASGKKLSIELYPMDENDRFGREQLGGVSAWTSWEGDTIHFVVYPSKDTIHTLKSTVVHEYHHHYRISALNNGHSNVTLLEKIIREGLAEHFVAEILGTDFHGPWVGALTEEDARMYWTTLYSKHTQAYGDKTDLFVFGGGSSGVPFWAGYSMGYYLVKWYRQLHPDASVMALTAQNSEEFIPCPSDV
jgi:uncharacterized protein YjaZ